MTTAEAAYHRKYRQAGDICRRIAVPFYESYDGIMADRIRAEIHALESHAPADDAEREAIRLRLGECYTARHFYGIS